MKNLIALLAVGAGAFAVGVSVERHFWNEPPALGSTRQAAPNRSLDTKSDGGSAFGSTENSDEPSQLPLDLGSLRKLAGSNGNSQAVRRALHRATREQVERIAATLDALDSGNPQDRDLKLAILHRLADLDPQGALTAILAEDDLRIKSDVIHHVFRQLARHDFASAKLAASQLEDRTLRREAIRAIAHEVGSENPVAVAQFLESLKDAREFGDFFERWAGKSPTEASRYVEKVQDEWKRREWTRSIARGWARSSDPSDTAAALSWAKSLKSGRERAEAVNSIAQTIADSDPGGAAFLLDELPADHTRRNFVEHLARTWAEQDLEGAFNWAEHLDGTLRSEAIEALLPAWVRADAASAAAYVEALPASERHLNSLRRVAETWSRIDKDAALAWAASQENPAAKGRALGGIAHAWARDDPQAASEMVDLLGQSEERLEVLDQIARSWSGENLGVALGWIEELPPVEKNRAYRGLLDNVAEFNPAQAASLYSKLASSNAESGGLQGDSGMAGHLAERWSRYDPAGAADWALTLPEGDTQRHAVERVADHWLRADPLEASKWIGQLDEGRARDVAAERLVDQIAESDPDTALQWALSVRDEGHQTRMMHHVYERWKKVDPAAAQQSLNAAPVSAEQRANLENLFK